MPQHLHVPPKQTLKSNIPRLLELFLSLSPSKNQVSYLVTVFKIFFIIWICYIKVNLHRYSISKIIVQISILKSIIKHSRSSIRKSSVLHGKLKKISRLHALDLFLCFKKIKSRNQCIFHWLDKHQSNIPRKSCLPWFLFRLFSQF